MAIYNTTFMNNATNIVDLIQGVGVMTSSTSNFLFGNLLLLSFYAVILGWSVKEREYNQVSAVGFFLCIILSILLYGAGLVASYMIAGSFIFFIMSLIVYFIVK